MKHLTTILTACLLAATVSQQQEEKAARIALGKVAAKECVLNKAGKFASVAEQAIGEMTALYVLRAVGKVDLKLLWGSFDACDPTLGQGQVFRPGGLPGPVPGDCTLGPGPYMCYTRGL